MQLKGQYNKVRSYTEEICTPLETEDYVVQVSNFASPPKWHLAHTTWFFETFILKQFLTNYKPFDKDFNFLFNSYYNNIGDRILQTNRGNMSRPSTKRIYEYREYVDTKIVELLNDNTDSKIEHLIILGLNHEQQHQELLITDIKYMFGHNPLFPVYNKEFATVSDKNNKTQTIKIEAGIYKIGYQGKEFYYDNELGVHKVYVNDFEINNRLVTNGDFIQFMEAGGYSDFNIWLDEGWTWVNDNKIESPMYWHKVDEDWHYYTLAGMKKVDKDAILSHINYYEAHAYAEWKGERLPTEFEWEIASEQMNWGERWEWTNSSYLAYPDFKKENGAVGEYNGKFMSNKMVLRGASVATSANHSRNTYRNFFHPTERWQYTGLRLVK